MLTLSAQTHGHGIGVYCIGVEGIRKQLRRTDSIKFIIRCVHKRNAISLLLVESIGVGRLDWKEKQKSAAKDNLVIQSGKSFWHLCLEQWKEFCFLCLFNVQLKWNSCWSKIVVVQPGKLCFNFVISFSWTTKQHSAKEMCNKFDKILS